MFQKLKDLESDPVGLGKGTKRLLQCLVSYATKIEEIESELKVLRKHAAQLERRGSEMEEKLEEALKYNRQVARMLVSCST